MFWVFFAVLYVVLAAVAAAYDGQAIATQQRTSWRLPAQQSRHLARIASIGDIGSWPIARSSRCAIRRGSRPTSQSSVPDGS